MAKILRISRFGPSKFAYPGAARILSAPGFPNLGNFSMARRRRKERKKKEKREKEREKKKREKKEEKKEEEKIRRKTRKGDNEAYYSYQK